ncbi:galactose mutarotase [Streptococcus sp. X16XC17]|uniref:aldose epimerase family protein n=1 Tax=unclassified Streptococcus TaxID=2608887 RepID=UPI00066FD7E6|nr:MULTISPECIES: aldose epimerase family protein [unclassified Streptococcus]TCD46744.1 galactose mutarotase [Streptococcus sp. X16XC17]
MEKQDFGQGATLYRLTNQQGMVLEVTDFGARIVAIKLPLENGELRNVTLTGTSKEEYEMKDPYVGASIVPVAGRISGAQTTIKDQLVHFTENEPGRTLHSGVDTANEHIWQVATDDDTNHIIFSFELADDFNGFPGPVRVEAIYQLTDENEVKISYKATSERDTIFNSTNHVYFNLAGNPQATIAGHRFKIDAQQFASLGEDNMPIGRLEDVEGTPFDFRKQALVDQGLALTHPQNQVVSGYDHPWLVNPLADYQVQVVSPDEQVRLKVKTNQPAVVIYTYNHGPTALAAQHGVFSLECQALPNAGNLPGFGSILLEKDNLFESHMIYQFDWK